MGKSMVAHCKAGFQKQKITVHLTKQGLKIRFYIEDMKKNLEGVVFYILVLQEYRMNR